MPTPSGAPACGSSWPACTSAAARRTTALDEIKQALHAKPDMAEAYNLRGLIYASLGDTQLAEDSFQRALQLNPRDADTMHNYGWFLCQQRPLRRGRRAVRAAR